MEKFPDKQRTVPVPGLNVASAESRLTTAINDAIRNAKAVPGSTLPNGAIVLRQEKIKDREYGVEYVVLCITPTPAFQPFVTWIRFIGAEQRADGSYGPLDYCFAGSYHRKLDAALFDFDERVS